MNNLLVGNGINIQFNESDCDMIKELLPTLNAQGKIRFLSVKTFWEDCYEK